jgi:membrane fusion protein, multidrug efflux system
MIRDEQRGPDEEKMGRKKSIFLKIFGPWTFFILLVALAAFFYVRSADDQEEDAPRERPPVAVETAPVVEMTLEDSFRGVGTLMPIQHVEIKPEVSGRIKGTHFQEGGFVSENKLLFEIGEQKQRHRLESSRASLDQARTRLDNLRRNYERLKSLYQQDLISEDEFDRSRTEMESASSEVERLAAQVSLAGQELGDTLIRAPFSGFISRRLVDPGAFVSQGQLLATMYQTDPLEISFMVPEKYTAQADYGQEVRIQVSAHPGQVFTGRVTFLSPSVDESTRSFEVKASIDNPDNRLRPGSFASAVLILGYREASLVIPERSLVATRDGYLVFVLDQEEGRVESRNVRTGSRRPGLVEILEGLDPGEQVVVAGHMNLNDKMQVRVVQESGPDWAGDHRELHSPAVSVEPLSPDRQEQERTSR